MKDTIDTQQRRHPARWVLLLVLAFWGLQTSAQALQFGSLTEVLAYADTHSAVAQGAQVQTELARLQSVAALANTVNLRGTASFSLTDNYALPVNFLPAEIFGGPAGTFRQVTFGQQFVNLASIAPQLDVINPSTWARVGSAKASAELTAVTNALNRRNLHESIATTYCNYRSVEAQLVTAKKNLANADTIAGIAFERYTAGLVRMTDWNNTMVNKTNMIDFVQQLQTKQAQLLLGLRALLGISADTDMQIITQITPDRFASGNVDAMSKLQARQSTLQASVQRSELLANRLAFLPTISVVAGFNWQQNSNEKMFNSASWIASRYVGFKLSVPLPTETRLWSQAEEYRINLKLKEINADQVALQESIQNRQLELDVERAAQAQITSKEVARLKQQNYISAMVNYQEGIIPADQLLIAFTDYLNAQLSDDASYWNLQLQLRKYSINQYAVEAQ